VGANELHPMGIGEILDVAIKLYRRNAWTLFRIVLVIAVPLTLLTNFILISAIPAHETPHVQTIGNQLFFVTSPTRSQWHTILAGFFVAGVLVMIGYLIATGAAYKAVAEAFLGGQPDWKRSLAFAARRMHSLLWVTVLGGLIVAVTWPFFVIPGLYFAVSFTVAIPVVMTEGLRGRKALGRSRRLIKKRWWRTFALLCLGSILSVILFYAAALLIFAVTAEEGQRSVVGVATNVVAISVLTALTIPFAAAYTTVLYFDLRVRREAFDLQLLALQVGVDATPAAQSP
jgi:hypothetical protein